MSIEMINAFLVKLSEAGDDFEITKQMIDLTKTFVDTIKKEIKKETKKNEKKTEKKSKAKKKFGFGLNLLAFF
jgi:hypothetical protein